MHREPNPVRATVGALALVAASSGAAGDVAPGAISYLTSPTGEHYTLSLPGGEAPAQPTPLVVSLHYGGPVSPHYGSGLLESVVEPGLRHLEAVVLAPDCGAQRWMDCESVVLALMDEVASRYAIDSERVLLTGYSKGGIGTWDLVDRHPDRFSAAVVMAGHPDARLTQANWRTPTLVIHARNDELFPVATTETVVAAMRTAGAPVKLEILDRVTHFETHRFATPLSRAVEWLETVWGQ